MICAITATTISSLKDKRRDKELDTVWVAILKKHIKNLFTKYYNSQNVLPKTIPNHLPMNSGATLEIGMFTNAGQKERNTTITAAASQGRIQTNV